MQSVKKILRFIWNKYVIIIIAFIIWMLFFDTNSYLAHRKLNSELSKVSEEKSFYIKQISQDKQRANDLMSNDENLEKYAREHYLMKKDNEDIYLIIED